MSFRVNDAQHAELEAEGPSANQAAKARAFKPCLIACTLPRNHPGVCVDHLGREWDVRP